MYIHHWRVALWLWWVTVSLQEVAGEFGDYADHSFSCPALTTCPVVCVATVQDCPAEMQCGPTETLCLDGTCATFCDAGLVSPCTEECALVACPHVVVASHQYCSDTFASWYENECDGDQDGVIEDDPADVADLSWFDPLFLFVYAWVLVSSAGIVGWSWYK